jgi:hypothetical protein
MKITTSDRMASDVLKEFLFIPRFQRPYSWEKEQVEQFWNDTIVENPTDYFIGSIVLYKQGDELGIVDGQQRIVTILLSSAPFAMPSMPTTWLLRSPRSSICDSPIPVALLIRCYRDKILSKKNLEATLWAVECFHFAFTAIAQRSSSGGISLMYASWAQRLSNATSDADRQKILSEIKKNLRDRIPDKADFVAGFKGLRYSDDFTKHKRIVRYVLEHIEDQLSTSGVIANYDQMTIEHIAPQKPTPGAPSISYEHIATVGNQFLCDSTLQERLKNKPFADKRHILKDCGVAAAKDVVATKDWDDKAIDERTDRLANLAYDEIWRA